MGLFLEIRPFQLEDYRAALELWKLCPDGIDLGEGEDAAAIFGYIQRNPGHSHVACAQGKVVGTIMAGHDGRRGFLHHLAVHPDFRQQGLGRSLVQTAQKALRREGVRRCHIFLHEGKDSSEGFWGSEGWQEREDVRVYSTNI